jgi:hypothetical protein
VATSLKPRLICSKHDRRKDTSGCGHLSNFTKLLQSHLKNALPIQDRIGSYLASYVTATSCTVASVAAGDIQKHKRINCRKNLGAEVRFEVLTTVTMKITVLWDV